MITSTLRLFNAVQVENRDGCHFNENAVMRGVRNGYVLDPAIKPTQATLNAIESVVGLSGEKANHAFHKSWNVVADTPIEILFLQQLLHYVTTYGAEAFGIYDQDRVYIPSEELNVPGVTEDVVLIVVQALTKEEILEKIIALGGSGVALAKWTLSDIVEIVIENQYNPEFVGLIKNRELKALLCDLYGIVPEEPVEFLRYLISKLTGESLLIKNKALVSKIESAEGWKLDLLLKDAPKNLGSIFLRYKPLFLAMKSISKNKTFFNRLRKDAVTMHAPLPVDYLNSVTEQIKLDTLDMNVLEKKLKDASVWRKIRLAYALNSRVNNGDSIVYNVRNGRGWVADFVWERRYWMVTKTALNIVLRSIAEGLNVKGKTVFIPEGVHYTLPATEKQFIGPFPTGSYVSVKNDMIVGIHWTNQEFSRIDLDFSMTDAFGKTGWDADYRSDDLLFSGDLTDAPEPKGASELFYARHPVSSPKLAMINYFNYSDVAVPTKVFIAQQKTKKEYIERNFLVDPNNILLTANILVTEKQTTLGLLVNVNGENRFCFSTSSIGSSISTRDKKQAKQIREFLTRSLVNSIELEDLLHVAGATIARERPLDGDYLDLSPEALDKTTILDLVRES